MYMCRLIKENGRAYRSSVREAREHRLSDAFVKRHAVRTQMTYTKIMSLHKTFYMFYCLVLVVADIREKSGRSDQVK